jgi:hypothetical protein
MRYYITVIITFIKKLFGIKPLAGLNAWLNKDERIDPALKIKNDYKQMSRYIVDQGVFKLQYVRYAHQRDNIMLGEYGPLTSCYPTSISMVIQTLEQSIYGGKEREEILKPNLENDFIRDLFDNDSLYRKINLRILGGWTSKIAPGYIAGFWVWYVNNKIEGYRARYQVFTQDELKVFIRSKSIPVTMETRLTEKGHIVVCVGFNKEGFYCNDSYGDGHSYLTLPAPEFGEGVFYANKIMKKDIGSVIITHEEI